MKIIQDPLQLIYSASIILVKAHEVLPKGNSDRCVKSLHAIISSQLEGLDIKQEDVQILNDYFGDALHCNKTKVYGLLKNGIRKETFLRSDSNKGKDYRIYNLVYLCLLLNHPRSRESIDNKEKIGVDLQLLTQFVITTIYDEIKSVYGNLLSLETVLKEKDLTLNDWLRAYHFLQFDIPNIYNADSTKWAYDLLYTDVIQPISVGILHRVYHYLNKWIFYPLRLERNLLRYSVGKCLWGYIPMEDLIPELVSKTPENKYYTHIKIEIEIDYLSDLLFKYMPTPKNYPVKWINGYILNKYRTAVANRALKVISMIGEEQPHFEPFKEVAEFVDQPSILTYTKLVKAWTGINIKYKGTESDASIEKRARVKEVKMNPQTSATPKTDSKPKSLVDIIKLLLQSEDVNEALAIPVCDILNELGYVSKPQSTYLLALLESDPTTHGDEDITFINKLIEDLS